MNQGGRRPVRSGWGGEVDEEGTWLTAAASELLSNFEGIFLRRAHLSLWPESIMDS